MLDVSTYKLLQTENDEWQTRPLVREGAPQRQESNFQPTALGQEEISRHKSQSGLDTLTYWPTDRQLQHDFDFGHPVPGGYKWGNLALEVWGVSDESLKYGYGFLGTLTIEWLHCKLQIHPLVRKGAPQTQDRNFQTATFRQEVISGRKSQSRLDTKTYWQVRLRTEVQRDTSWKALRFCWVSLLESVVVV
jgi:hypothetical protein